MASKVTARPDIKAFHTLAFDFDGVFTDNRVWVGQDGRESVCCDRRDGLAIDLMRAFIASSHSSMEMMVLSTEANPVVAARARKLGLDCRQSVGDKLQFMRQYLAEQYPDEDQPLRGLIYLGNDLNDLALMRAAGYAVAPGDAHPRVLAVADLVLAQKGGDGFVRALVEYILDIDKMMDADIEKLISNR